MQINVELLQKLDACQDQIDKFVEIYGDSDAPLTVDEALKRSMDFDFIWFVYKILNDENLKVYENEIESYLQTYQDIIDAHWNDYAKELEPLWHAYKESIRLNKKPYAEVKDSLFKTYEEARKPYWKIYEEVTAPHNKVYNDVVAKTFAKLYLKQNGIN